MKNKQTRIIPIGIDKTLFLELKAARTTKEKLRIIQSILRDLIAAQALHTDKIWQCRDWKRDESVQVEELWSE